MKSEAGATLEAKKDLQKQERQHLQRSIKLVMTFLSRLDTKASGCQQIQQQLEERMRHLPFQARLHPQDAGLSEAKTA